MLLGRSASFDLALASAALLGVVARRMLIPFVSCQDYHGRISEHYGLVLQSVFCHLGYLPSLASQPCLIWIITSGIRFDLEVPFLFGCLRHFWRGLWSGRRIFSTASARSGISVPYEILVVLRSCWWACYIPTHPLVVSSGDLSSQSSPRFSGFSEVLVRTTLQLQSNIPGSLDPALCCYRLETKKFSTGRLPSLRRAFECSRISSFLWGGEDKNRVNRIIGQ